MGVLLQVSFFLKKFRFHHDANFYKNINLRSALMLLLSGEYWLKFTEILKQRLKPIPGKKKYKTFFWDPEMVEMYR